MSMTDPLITSFISIGTHRLSLFVLGPPRSPFQPAIILEAGAGASSHGLIALARAISSFARVFTYDRSGFGLSEPFPKSTESTSLNHVKALRKLLKGAGCEPPFVLVGHSYGGNLVRLFSSEYPNDVKGLVLVDAIPIVPEKPVGRIVHQLLGHEGDYYQAIGLMAADKLTAEEQQREKDMDALGEENGAMFAEIRHIRAGVEEVNGKQGIEFADGKLVCRKQALSSKRVGIVSGGLGDDFRKIYEYAEEKGNASEEAREEMRVFLEEWKPERFSELQQAMTGLSSEAKFVQMEGVGRTHMLVQTVPEEIARVVRWVSGME